MRVKNKCIVLAACFLPLLCLFSIVTFSQKKETPIKKIYLQLASGPVSHNGVSGEIGVQAVLKNNWTATVSWQSIEMDPKGLPADYKQGYVFPVFFDEYPFVNMKLYSITGGKCFETGRNIWFITEAGVTLVNGAIMKYSPQPIIQNGLYTSSNYAISKEDKTTVGLILKADFNWAFLPFAGLGTGVFANFSSIQSPIGFQLKLLLGKMNRKGKKETQ